MVTAGHRGPKHGIHARKDAPRRLTAVRPRRDRSLGFPLPPECEGGRELAWLPKASRKPPESAGSTREAILKGKGKGEGVSRP